MIGHVYILLCAFIFDIFVFSPCFGIEHVGLPELETNK